MEYNIEQQMLTLSYIAYCGYALTGSDQHNARKIAPAIEQHLATEAATTGKWRLVWGPAVTGFWYSIFDDNMSYIVQHIDKPNCFAVVFRGTNPVALSNWLVEDFAVIRTSPWRIGAKRAPNNARISHGTRVGMQKVQSLTAPTGVPGAGTTMLQFLRIQSETQTDPLEVYVTGHSLGGTLSATYGLFLKQTSGRTDIPKAQQWDPEGLAAISVVAYAGATAGNKAFAEYSDSLLTAQNFKRLANSKDVVPHAWNRDSMKQVPDLYEPVASCGLIMDLLLTRSRIASFFHNYTQPQAEQPYLIGTLEPACKEFLQQAIYQHVVAYPTLMGLEGILDPLIYFPILKEILPDEKGNVATVV